MSIRYKALSLCSEVAAATLSLFAVAPAYAQSDIIISGPRVSVLHVKRVNHADLNLAYWQHQRTLVRRVNYAIKEVCWERLQHAENTLASFARYRQCREFAWTGAGPQVARAVYRDQLRYG